MILSGLLSTMNVSVDKYEDIRFSINDAYMILLMTGWMFLFMGLVNKDKKSFMFGLILVVTNVWCIRTQFMVNEKQYKLGMIPHHSMAIHMSKKLLEKKNNIQDFLKNIIRTQETEITFMKR
uniref:DUF305 domain-containing protein n=1 Tax=viral metagenome TaxID=1070528 RepID=A0A6C0IH98_9ZZZZ